MTGAAITGGEQQGSIGNAVQDLGLFRILCVDGCSEEGEKGP